MDRRALEWSLSRCQGYVGVTNALSGLRGDRFAASSAFAMVTAALARRGLLYLDAGGLSAPPADPASRPGLGVHRADLTLDEQPDAADIEARLSRLEQLAREHGSALGVAGPLRPVVIERLRAWSRHLAARGIALVPVSALPPPAASAVAPAMPPAPTVIAAPPAGAGHGVDRRASTRAAGHRRARPRPAAVPARSAMSQDAHAQLPYRPNVGAALFDRGGRVLVCRRADLPNAEGAAGVWQLPQGGIDDGEDPARAVLRELREEVGTDNAEILGHHPEWLSYDLPPHLLGRALGGRYRGQRQLWFALRYLGGDDEIRLDLDPHPEFDAWRWLPLDALPTLEVGFKRSTYAILATAFAPYAAAATRIAPAC